MLMQLYSFEVEYALRTISEPMMRTHFRAEMLGNLGKDKFLRPPFSKQMKKKQDSRVNGNINNI